MKNFFKQVLAVIVGLTIFQIIAFIIAMIFFGIIVGSIATLADGGESKQVVDVKNNSVLWMDLSYELKERDGYTSFDLSALNNLPSERAGLHSIIHAIDVAKTDDKIDGIYLDVSLMPNGFASTDAIRRALLDFKTSGKFIISYGEMMTQKSYYLASVADEIYLNPSGILELRGIGTKLTFFHKMITEKLDAEVQVFKVGTFKSAVEPYIREDMSEDNRKQMTYLLSDIKEDFVRNIANARGLEIEELNRIIDGLLVRKAGDAVGLGLVDGTWYYDQVLDLLAEKTGTDETKDLEYIEIGKYASANKRTNTGGSDKIAVVFAEGGIVDGDGEEDNIGGAKFARTVREIRGEEDIKAIVLRVNSGGGSALASEVIWREFELVSQDIPFVVSMGDVAASGGYYIACNADKIYAEENTITGSIGVFGLIPNFENFFNNKLGITFDEVDIHEHATADGFTEPFDAYEAAVIQTSVDNIYETFTSRVAKGRDMPLDSVLKYGEGRVWTGQQAMKIGLVDEIGGLQEAIAHAATLADISSYGVKDYPKQKNPFEMIIEDITGEKTTKYIENELGEYYTYVEQMQQLQEMQKGVQASLPYEIEVY